jgi:hypothetical protein
MSASARQSLQVADGGQRKPHSNGDYRTRPDTDENGTRVGGAPLTGSKPRVFVAAENRC